MAELTVVIPARDEATCIRQTILGIQDHVPTARILVVVDDVKDQTWHVAEDAGADAWVTGRRGYGHAVRAGLRDTRTPWVTVMTADGSDSPVDLRRMMTLAHSTQQSVFGDRFSSGRPITYPRLKWVINRLGNRLAARLIGTDYADLTNPFKLYPTTEVNALLPHCRATDMSLGFELACAYVLGGGWFSTIPITWWDRTSGKSKFSSRQTLGYLRTLRHVVL